MILFVFEGEKREPQIFESLKRLYFHEKEDLIVCSYGNNIYALYQQIKELGEGGDIVALLKTTLQERGDNILTAFSMISDFAEIYLFFDYDFHINDIPLEMINTQLQEMLTFFNEETENGKLYINYPMLESIRYTKELPDAHYYEYTVKRIECNDFKYLVQEFSFYKNLDFVRIKKSEEWNEEVKQSWEYLKEQNIQKANYICNNVVAIPRDKSGISQLSIFNEQLKKYVNTKDCRVSILNSFAIFIFDYFK